MRKIKLQMTASIDGFVKSKQGDSVWDKDVTDFCIKNLEDTDAILLGRNRSGVLYSSLLPARTYD